MTARQARILRRRQRYNQAQSVLGTLVLAAVIVGLFVAAAWAVGR